MVGVITRRGEYLAALDNIVFLKIDYFDPRNLVILRLQAFTISKLYPANYDLNARTINEYTAVTVPCHPRD